MSAATCFAAQKGGVDTQLVLNGATTEFYDLHRLGRSGNYEYNGDLHVLLGQKYSLKIQNSNPNATLRLKIKGLKSGNVIYNDSAGLYRVIFVSN